MSKVSKTMPPSTELTGAPLPASPAATVAPAAPKNPGKPLPLPRYAFTWLNEAGPERPATGDAPSASPIYRSIMCPVSGPIPTNDWIGTELRTVADVFNSTVRKFGNEPFLGVRSEGGSGPYVFETYGCDGLNLYPEINLLHIRVDVFHKPGLLGCPITIRGPSIAM